MTKEEIGAKLRAQRISCGMTQQEVAEKIGRKQPIIGHWETGYSQPDANTLFTLCDIYNTTVDEVFGFSKGKASFSKQERDHIEKYRSLDPYGQQTVDMIMDREFKRTAQVRESQTRITKLEGQVDIRYTPKHLLAYYGRIAAAGKSYGFEDVLCGTIEVDLTDDNQKADYAIGVSGDSMEPDYTGEDIVYVQKTTHLEKGDIGIFQKDNCIYIKKVGDGELVSINPNYEPIPGADVKVLGRVLGKIDGDYRIIGS